MKSLNHDKLTKTENVHVKLVARGASNKLGVCVYLPSDRVVNAARSLKFDSIVAWTLNLMLQLQK